MRECVGVSDAFFKGHVTTHLKHDRTGASLLPAAYAVGRATAPSAAAFDSRQGNALAGAAHLKNLPVIFSKNQSEIFA